MNKVTVIQSDIYISFNKYCFTVDWSDNEYILLFEYRSLPEAMKWWGKSDEMISQYCYGGEVEYSDFPNCEAIRKLGDNLHGIYKGRVIAI